MRVLMVGAGAVGQVYGHHLARGGAEVAFWVKPKHAAAVQAGMTLSRLQIGRKPVTEQMAGCRALTTVGEIRQQTWDQVWLCVSTPALQGGWLGELLAATGKATIVVLQPGLGVRERILRAWREASGIDEATLAPRLVTGLITLVAYQAPLPGEAMAPGMAFWLPPLAPLPLEGERQRIDPVVARLNNAGCPAVYANNVTQRAIVGSSILMPQIAALEASGWSLSTLRRSKLLGLACRASRQMMDVAAAHQRMRPPAAKAVAQPWLLGPVLALAPAVVPLPIEPYLKYHFTKVGDQTRAMLQTHLELGERHGVAVDSIRELAAALQQAPQTLTR